MLEQRSLGPHAFWSQIWKSDDNNFSLIPDHYSQPSNPGCEAHEQKNLAQPRARTHGNHAGCIMTEANTLLKDRGKYEAI